MFVAWVDFSASLNLLNCTPFTTYNDLGDVDASYSQNGCCAV
mgnify:CR=1 FL=1